MRSLACALRLACALAAIGGDRAAAGPLPGIGSALPPDRGAAEAPIPDGAFVRVMGHRFVVSGRPFAFVGANLDVLHGAINRAQAAATITAARGDGLTVGRIWALGEGDATSTPWSRTHQLFRAGPDQWLEDAFEQLDQVLVLARARGLRLILTLANAWDDYGGVRQYLSWAGLPSQGRAARERFFVDTRLRAYYRAHLWRLLTRVNHLTGVRYIDDPTIFAWELMNESHVLTASGAAARRAWIAEMTAFIRSYDRNHLVTPGLIGYRSRAERREWLAACRLPAVDYCDSHLYPETDDRVSSLARLESFIDDRVQLAHYVAHKPIVFGEFGFHTTQPGFLGTPRATWFATFLRRVFFDGAAGALAWIYQPWSGKPRDFGIYVDRTDTDDVRAILRRFAKMAQTAPPGRNRKLSAARGAALLYDPYRTEHRSPHVHLREAAVELVPSAFAVGHWERLGSFGKGPKAHVYGAGDGWFEYRFWLPRAAEVTLVARLSSEWPGASAPADGGSMVRVEVDRRPRGLVAAVPDDGVGRVERLPLGRLGAGRHRLRLAVPGPEAHGLCVYGDEATPLRLELGQPRSARR